MIADLFTTQITPQNRCSGISLAEYSMLFGTVCVVAIGGLVLLRDATAGLYQDSDLALAKGTTLTLLAPKPQSSSGSAHPAQKGYYELSTDASGHPSLRLVEANNSSGKNVSSIDGDRLNTLGSVMISSTLEEMAKAETDPDLKAYYGQLANVSYYLGGAEGEMDDIPGLAQPGYSKGDALSDLVQKQNKLRSLIENPPPQMTPEKFAKVMPMAVEVNNIAQDYIKAFGQFMDDTGKSTGNIGDPNRCTSQGCLLGDGTPGSAIKQASLAVENPTGAIANSGKPYETYRDYETLQKAGDELVDNRNKNQGDPAMVEATMANGRYYQNKSDNNGRRSNRNNRRNRNNSRNNGHR